MAPHQGCLQILTYWGGFWGGTLCRPTGMFIKRTTLGRKLIWALFFVPCSLDSTLGCSHRSMLPHTMVSIYATEQIRNFTTSGSRFVEDEIRNLRNAHSNTANQAIISNLYRTFDCNLRFCQYQFLLLLWCPLPPTLSCMFPLAQEIDILYL